jgi:hypothetical protein
MGPFINDYLHDTLPKTLLAMNETTTPPPRKKRRIQEDDDVEKYSTYFVEASGSSAKLEQTYVYAIKPPFSIYC